MLVVARHALSHHHELSSQQSDPPSQHGEADYGLSFRQPVKRFGDWEDDIGAAVRASKQSK